MQHRAWKPPGANALTEDARFANRRSGRLVSYRSQRDPHSEEPEAPLVETGIPDRGFLVAPVVDRAVVPAPTGRGKRSIPRRPRRLARAPGSGAVAPRGAVEVAALGVSMPGAAGVGIGSTESAGSTGVIAGAARPAGATGVVTGPAGPARAAGVISGSGRATGTARVTGPAGPARASWTAGIVRTGGRVATAGGRRPAMITRRLWRSGSSVGKPGAHSQGRSAERSGDGHPSDKLLQLHDASPIH